MGKGPAPLGTAHPFAEPELLTPGLQRSPVQRNNFPKNTLQLATRISHTTSAFHYQSTDPATGLPDPASEQVGVHMTAQLDPMHPVIGSATTAGGGDQHGLMRHLNHDLQWNMVRGHLLNHDLGGFGTSDNLFPITNYSTLFVHAPKVEYLVKDALGTARKNQLAGHQPDGVYYSVEVDSGMSESALLKGSDFICHAHYLDNVTGAAPTKSQDILDVTISSQPPKAGTSHNTYHPEQPMQYLAGSHPIATWAHHGEGATAYRTAAITANQITNQEEGPWTTWARMGLTRGQRIGYRHQGRVLLGAAMAIGAIAATAWYGW